VRLPFLLYPNAAIHSLHKQIIAFFAGFTPKLNWQSSFHSHSNLSCRQNILCSQFRVSSAYFFGLLEEYLDALPRYLLNIGLLLHRIYQTISKGSIQLHNTCALIMCLSGKAQASTASKPHPSQAAYSVKSSVPSRYQAMNPWGA